ncbi:MAG: oxidase [Gemmatimonadetes bacterium]|nr:oxidase [Gemmatimonadota bacterium]
MRSRADSGAFVVQDVAGAAEQRRSIRRYAETEIPEEEIRDLLRLAGRAPSAFNAQPWRFIVVRDEALKAGLAAAANNQQQVIRAPATIVMYSDMQNALERLPEAMHPDMPAEQREAGVKRFRASFETKSADERENWGANQANIALGYLLLLAESKGLATSPMLGFDAEKVKALLGLPSHVRIPALVSIGYPDEEGFRPHRISSETLVEFR